MASLVNNRVTGNLLSPRWDVVLSCAETGGQRVQADHTRHAGGEDHGPAEVQDEHR